jgi:hypothetical protein
MARASGISTPSRWNPDAAVPYGCEFCTVTGFFGDSIRFRSNESVVNEMLMLKRRAERDKRQDHDILHRRQLCDQQETHEIAAARHYRR